MNLKGLAGVSDEGLGHLGQLSQLQGLDIGGTGVSDAGLRVLWGLKQLTSLSLAGTQVSGEVPHQEAQQQQQQEQEEEQLWLPEQANVNDFQHQDVDQQLLLAGLVGAGHGDVWGVVPVPHHHHQQQQQQDLGGAAQENSSGIGWHSLQQLVELDITDAPFGLAAYQELGAGLGGVLRKLGVGGKDFPGRALSSIKTMERLQELSIQVGLWEICWTYSPRWVSFMELRRPKLCQWKLQLA